jgi:hypothetical protein
MAAKTSPGGCGFNALVSVPQLKAEQIRTFNRNMRLAVLNRLAHKATGIISIDDNGIGREASAISKAKNGKGSKLIQERLEILQEKQGEKYRLEITDLTGDETGTRVEIFIPEEN